MVMGPDSDAAFSEMTIENPQAIWVTVKGDPSPVSAAPRVELDLSRFHAGRWALQLDAAFARRETPAVILAEGVACLAVAWWAQLSPRSYLDGVCGAVFRSPLHIGFGHAAIAAAARTGPLQRLPFPSIVACEVTPYVDQVLALADSWGSRFVDAGAPVCGAPSNRLGGGSDVEDLLLGYFAMIEDGRGPALPIARFAGADALALSEMA